MQDGALDIVIRGDNSNFKRSAKDTEKTISSLVSKAKTLAMALGVGVVAKESVKAFSELQTSVAKASTLFGDVAVDTENLSSKLKALSNEVGISASSLGDSLYNALSAGLPVSEDMAESLSFMKENAKLAKAGFTDIDTAVSSTAKILNAYGKDVSETARVHQVLMQTQNLGITTVGELGTNLAKVTPLASAMGLSFEDVGASLAVMTKAGTQTAEATTQLRAVLNELGKNGTQASKNLEEATGKSFQAMLKDGKNLQEVLAEMDKYAKKNGLSLSDMFGSIEAGVGALQLVSDATGTYNRFLGELNNSTGLVAESFEKVNTTLAEQANQTKTILTNIFSSLAGSQAGGLANLQGLLNETLSGVFSSIETKDMSKLISVVSSSLSKLATVIVEKTTSAFEQLPTIILNAGNKIAEILPDFIKKGMELATSLITGFVDSIPQLTASILNSVFNIVESLDSEKDSFLTLGKNFIISLVNGIVNSFREVGQTIINIASAIGQIFSMVDWGAVGKDLMLKIYNGIISMFKKVGESIKNIGVAIKNMILKGMSFGEAFGEAFKEEIAGEDGVITSVDELFNAMKIATRETIKDAGKRAGIEYNEGFQETALETIDAPTATAITSTDNTSVKKTDDGLDEKKKRFESFHDFLNTEIEDTGKKYTEMFSAIGQGFLDTLSAMTDMQNQYYQNNIDALQKELDARLESGDITQEQEKELSHAIMEEKRKQFEANKRNNVAQALMSGAQAIMSIWAEWGGLPIVAGVLSALATATTAMQVGTINAQQFQGFEKGGIVGGSGITGDKHPIFANAGELILNHAQQGNLAGQLNTSSAPVISITFSGQVFGSQEEISRFVYDGIKRAQNEGALRQW